MTPGYFTDPFAHRFTTIFSTSISIRLTTAHPQAMFSKVWHAAKKMHFLPFCLIRWNVPAIDVDIATGNAIVGEKFKPLKCFRNVFVNATDWCV